MRFLDLFSGIGGFRLGLEMAGHECVGHVEIDKYANKSYKAIHQPKEREFFHEDITTITDESIRELRNRGIDIIAGGFPCQAFSVAGKRRGLEDIRGTLFFDIARIAKEIKPKYLLLENVKGLLNHDRGDTFEVILRSLDEIGYDAEWQVLNSKHFGVPQNRERVFIIGHLRGSGGRKVFPIRGTNTPLNINVIGTTKNHDAMGTNCRHWVHDTQGIVGALSATDYKQPKQILAPYKADKNGDPMFTLTAQDRHGVAVNEPKVIDDQGRVKDSYKQHDIVPTLRAQTHGNPPKLVNGFRIRKLTPKECWRLQGFPDWAFERAKAVGVSDSQLYKQAGNSVTVNVIYEIAKKIG
jgi:DNA (cytosine-5)-methyltransferase 1